MNAAGVDEEVEAANEKNDAGGGAYGAGNDERAATVAATAGSVRFRFLAVSPLCSCSSSLKARFSSCLMDAVGADELEMGWTAVGAAASNEDADGLIAWSEAIGPC